MPNWCTTNITMQARDESAAAKAAIKNLKENIEYFFNSPDNDISLVRNDFGNSWLGNFILQNNIGCDVSSLQNAETDTERCMYNSAFESKDGKRIYSIYRCRGSITYMDDFYDDYEDITSFSFTQEDAWGPCLLMWKEIIARNYSDANGPLILIWYQAEEPGNELYFTNDTEGRFYPDTWILEGDIKPRHPNLDMIPPEGIYFYDFYSNDNEVLSFIKNNITSRNFKTVEQASEFIHNELESVPLFVNHNPEIENIQYYDDCEYFGAHEYRFAEMEDIDYVNDDEYKIIKKLEENNNE